MNKTIRLGTRGSALAMKQAEEVKQMLLNAVPGIMVNTVIIKTEGDQDTVSPLSSFDGRGAFVRSIETALLNGAIDFAVHSLKDLPSKLPEGLMLGASPVREDPRDVIVTGDGLSFESLPSGSVIGTGSIRRSSQIQRIRPDLQFKEIRGNIGTRLKKLKTDDYDAVVFAAAALKRLDIHGVVSRYLDVEECVPAPCQGAIGIECRSDDSEIIEILKGIDNKAVRICVDAERKFIFTLDMGCHSPVGAYARADGEKIEFSAYLDCGQGKILKNTIRNTTDGLLEAVENLARLFLNEV